MKKRYPKEQELYPIHFEDLPDQQGQIDTMPEEIKKEIRDCASGKQNPLKDLTKEDIKWMFEDSFCVPQSYVPEGQKTLYTKKELVTFFGKDYRVYHGGRFLSMHLVLLGR